MILSKMTEGEAMMHSGLETLKMILWMACFLNINETSLPVLVPFFLIYPSPSVGTVVAFCPV